MTTKDTPYLNVNLPKWPTLIVTGDKVTETQAAEIIIKTSRAVPEFHYASNDDRMNQRAADLFGVPADDGPQFPNDEKDRDGPLHRAYYAYTHEREAALDDLNKRLRLIQLTYLHNSRIASCYVGGSHGWCDWDGTIRTSSYNIGKWPSVEEVLEDWQAITTAFPFLNLQCQLCNHEAGYPEEGQINGPVVHFHIHDGVVDAKTQSPGEDPYLVAPRGDLDLAHIAGLINGTSSEWGVSIEELRRKLKLVYREIPQYKVVKS